ncbi:uncharacterized protein LOC62_07G009280 [Vanrija pseudolonga]|uniref:Uncharacterized protein n=1 Tax=Vanrija pseudolonga TaxID=143232 RepID=A0AAF0YKL4_9TREE|nr:hypothetical protein LOC62_07G009280 [Vanrija pseudolonga]
MPTDNELQALVDSLARVESSLGNKLDRLQSSVNRAQLTINRQADAIAAMHAAVESLQAAAAPAAPVPVPVPGRTLALSPAVAAYTAPFSFATPTTGTSLPPPSSTPGGFSFGRPAEPAEGSAFGTATTTGPASGAAAAFAFGRPSGWEPTGAGGTLPYDFGRANVTTAPAGGFAFRIGDTASPASAFGRGGTTPAPPSSPL